MVKLKRPPFSKNARIEAGVLVRRLQEGDKLSLPHSRPMPSIGARCHELRITDEDKIWRIIHRVDSDLVLIADVFSKKTAKTPKDVIANCKRRLKRFDDLINS